ncbi:MAG: amidohydrolase [Alphaproteobacteria bacterium]|nr:amidohydrolase [Alphaproteobacteria bacterium]
MSILIRQVLLNNKPVDILINKNKIEKIASHIPTALSDEIVQAEGKAILPAFYNMHTHSPMVLLRGIGEDKDLFSWLQNDIWPREEKLTGEQIYIASRMAILEMIKTGTVLFNDMYFFMDETIRAIDEMGARGLISCVAMDLFDPKKTLQKKKDMAHFIQTPCSNKQVIKTIACHAVYTVSEELLLFSKDLAQKHNTYLHIHLAETEKEVLDCIEKTGLTPTKYLDKLGLLTPKTILAHCVWLNDEDQNIIKERGCLIAHCPISNLKLNSGQMPLNTYLKKGLKVALGTDGASSNNALSMFSEMKVAALSAKGESHDITAAPVSSILKMAHQTPAEFLGLNAGKIIEGALADFIFVDTHNTLTHPLQFLDSHCVYSLDSSCVSDVCVNGRFVLKNKNHPLENEIIDSFFTLTESFF